MIEQTQQTREFLPVNADELFEQARAGLAAEQRLKAEAKDPLMDISLDQRESMQATIDAGNQSAWEIAIATIGIARMKVNELLKTYPSGTSFDRQDLMHVALIGIFDAAKRFNPNYNPDGETNFATYAGEYAWGYASTFIHNNNTMHLPGRYSLEVNKMERIKLNYQQEYGELPSISYVSKKMGISERRVCALVIARLRTRDMTSLDIDFNPDSYGPSDEQYSDVPHFIDRWCPPELTEDEVVGRIHNNYMEGLLVRGLQILKDRERKIIITRYGLDGLGSRTLEEVGKEYGVTRERIRQIEVKIFEKLRPILERGNKITS